MARDAERARVLSRGDVNVRAAFGVRRAAFGVRRTTFGLQRTACVVLALFGCRRGEPGTSRQYGVGRPASAQEIAALDIDVGPDGVGLPAGSGSVTQGESVYAQK